MALPLFASAQPAVKRAISVAEPPADTSSEAELASFKVLDGFEVNLFASERDGIPNALVIRWDERGRLWCLQTSAYPQPAPGDPVDDKVVILEDTNGDGRADKSTVWASGLRMPMGMELGGPGQLYVGEGEKLLLLTDTDGDDKADQREVIFSGFGTGDTHQNLNSFIWAPDGCLIMHQGLHTYSRVTTPWGVKQLYGSGFWRFWPRSRKLEAYPTGMPANAWGTAFDKWGQPIMVAGAAGMFWARPLEVAVGEREQRSDPSIVKEAQPDTYHFLLTRFMLPHSGQIIKTEGLRKFCGVDIPGNAHWPNHMQGDIVAGGFFENAIHRYKIIDDKDNPSGFEAIEQPPLITSDNVAFRPVDVRFGPDGALYIADWFNPIIGHYQASFRHPNRDKGHGRIWRVAVKGTKSARFAVLNAQAVAENAGLLASPDRWLRYQAQRLFMHGVTAFEETRLVLGSEDGASDPQRKLAAIQMAEMMETPNFKGVEQAANDPNENVRAYATHAVGNWADRWPNALELLDQRVSDDSARVRLEAIVAAAKIKSPDAIKVALKALDKPMDSFLDRTLWLAVHATAPQWKANMNFFASLPLHHMAFLVEKEGSDQLLAAVRFVLAVKQEELSVEAARALRLALVRKGGSGDVLGGLQSGIKDQPLLDEFVEIVARQRLKLPLCAADLVLGLLKVGTNQQQVAACKLAAAWRIGRAKPLIQQNAKSRMPELRAAALVALAQISPDSTILEALVENPAESWQIRTTALSELTETRPASAGTRAAKALSSIPDAETMIAWLTPLLAREGATNALAKALDREPCSNEAAKLALTTLTAAGRSDAGLVAAFGKIIGVKNVVPAYDPAWVDALAAEVKSNGDPEKGRTVFAAPLSGCVACHQIDKIGGTIGPELDAVGRGVPLELLIEAVVWPNRQIKEGYVATTLTTTDGRRMQGYKITEGNNQLQIKDFLTGTITQLPTNQIKERQEAGSLMPEGLVINMTREELRDLIAYLAALGR